MPGVLVVDDEPLISMLVIDWLQELGFATLGPAHSVAAALELVTGSAPDGAILDLCIGPEPCDPVAQALHARGVPFIVSSGRDVDEFAKRFPGTIVLPKPFDFEALKGSMGRLLGAR